ncbi:MAG: VCBS repeat-containing protein, partial [Thermoplasmata archaeon]
MAEGQPWTDNLDDASHVYVPPGGLYNVEVSGGEVHLKSGELDGWIASEVIRCPLGYRYDLVFLDVDAPGGSYVKVSVLDATAGPSQAGFANETIPEHRKVQCTDLSLNHIDPAAYPEIRIQVNLYSDGIDFPKLLAWTVYFVSEDEWHDDFLGTGKLLSWGGLNVSGGTARVRVAEKVLDVVDYEIYPAIAVPRYRGLNMFYRNSSDGYGYRVEPTEKDYWAIEVDDMNSDGYLDLVCSDGWTWGDIYWGNENGIYTEENRGPLNLPALDFATGDFDGDGWKDVAGAVPRGWGSSSVIMLNQGDGVFIKDVNISITGIQTQFAAAGDINGDGYDDAVLNTAGASAYIFFGGPDGPNSTPDAEVVGWYPEVVDLDRDGYDDIIEFQRWGMSRTHVNIYLGGPDFDTKRDHFLDLPVGNVSEVAAGDINGDGFMDLMFGYFGTESHMRIIPGSETGWDVNESVFLTQGASWYEMDVGDIDKDGYDDIVYNHGSDITWVPGLAIAYGGEEFPTEPDFYRDFLAECGPFFNDIAIVMPKAARYPKHPRGSLITEHILLPEGKRWDILHMEGTLPKDTWSTVSVIDPSGNPIAGIDEVEGMSVDLSGIDPDVNVSIRVHVRIGSQVNTTTPVLDKLTVTFRDRNTWRDGFHTCSRVDRSVNLAILDGTMSSTDDDQCGPTIILPSFQGDGNEYLTASTFTDTGGGDYLNMGPMGIAVEGAEAVDAKDIDGDGFSEMVFAVYRTAFDTYRTKSPLYAGTPLGPANAPLHEFNTEGATGVALEDLNDDGHYDVVFSQERDMGSYNVDSVLYWGTEDGWPDTPDVKFKTKGASDVEVADLNGDGRLDLVFSCFSDATGTSTDSLVFLQDGAGFSGANPTHRLATVGARAVAVDDLNGDLVNDVAFANHRDGGILETASFIYWGSVLGGFDSTPTSLPTLGAMDVEMVDVDGDLDRDLVFANMMNDTHSHGVPSYVYLNDGNGGFSTTPDHMLPTTGAVAVDAGDIDDVGWVDLVFACGDDGDTHRVDSCIYLGGRTGWGGSADVHLPTYGASDV